MPQTLSADDRERTISAYQAAFTAGHTLDGRPSIHAVVGKAIGITATGARFRYIRITEDEGHKFKMPKAKKAAPPKIEAPADPVAERRQKDALADMRRQRDEAVARAIVNEDWRHGILNLTKERLRPTLDLRRRKRAKMDAGGRIIIGHLSDLHMGESVGLGEMDGLNSFNAAIAHARLRRFFDKIISLSTTHWTGEPPREFVLCLGGDMISGDIHDELYATNEPYVPGQVREAAQAIAGGILSLRREIGIPVRVYTVPGNHGRLTKKPTSKGRALNSLDLLVSDFAEAVVVGSGQDGITFFSTPSPDAYFSTFGFHWHLLHGDTMGSGGGQGWIGPAAPITKGHRKVLKFDRDTGRPIYRVLTGHYHTTMFTGHGYANGSVPGPTEYSRDGRMDAEPPQQNMLVVHELLGVIKHMTIFLGGKGEGTICDPANDSLR